MHSSNLGILAHVDAGKTTLTERLLYAAGVIDSLGSVDRGSTQTDTLALERRRGITIKAAVVSFMIGDVAVNLIDTPGHPDFIAEVERALGALDGAVLVVSAVEGVQAQTRVLMRALRRLAIPTLLFVNKIDRTGADPDRVLRAIVAKLTPDVVPMGTVTGAGSRGAAFVPHDAGHEGHAAGLAEVAEILADHDDALLAAYVDGTAAVPYARLRRALADQTGRALVHPAYAGSAATGAGVPELMAGIAELLPGAAGDAGGPLSGTVFKVERGPSGERLAYVRLFTGTLHVRDRLGFRGGDGERVTGIEVFDRGAAVPRPEAVAGQIAKLRGLTAVRIGDTLGDAAGAGHHFAPPTLETAVTLRRPGHNGALHAAVAQLAEQDPLINLRQDDGRRELYLSLYGEVQKEVIRDTLADDFGLDVEFRATTTICVERVAGTGEDVQPIGPPNPFLAGVGLRVQPGPPGTGTRFGLAIELGALPSAFLRAIEETVRTTLHQGLHGWDVVDCTVTLTASGYWPRQSARGAKFDPRVSSTAGAFRDLTPLVLMAALRRAGTVVHEPMHRFHLDAPADTLGPLLPVLAGLGATPEVPDVSGPAPGAAGGVEAGDAGTLTGEIPAVRVHELTQLVPGLTRGEGVLECAFARYRPVRGAVPSRPRTDRNPLDRTEYLRNVVERA